MISDSLWILGPSRSGKTTRLVDWFYHQVSSKTFQRGLDDAKNQAQKLLYPRQTQPGFLVLAANDDNRRQLVDKIVTTTEGKYPVRGKTILGFFQDEVILFWPLLVQSLKLKAQFPVRLRPETEQELATKLWRPRLNMEILRRAGVNEYRLVRRILDLLQLAAYGGINCEDIGHVLTKATRLQENEKNIEPEFLSSLLLDWRNWCLERGFLTYGIVTELYTQHLLPHTEYQQQLAKRYQVVLADDVQDYPSVARHLFEFLLAQGAVGAFSYNPDGVVRLGLGADPAYLEGLATHCQVETLTQQTLSSLADILTTSMVELVTQPMSLSSLPEVVQSIQTTSRSQLLRQTAEIIVDAIKQQRVQPNEIAIIAPGLDAIARYTIVEILTKQNIAVEPLNDQLPLISSPLVRGLLTILALVYPGLGRLVDRDAITEMLVVLSGGVSEWARKEGISPTPSIDPVRAGLIADYCFMPHPDCPNLLPVTAFDRWDRLGYGATTAYNEILQWIEKQRSQQELRLIPSPISLLDRAIQHFLWNGSNLPYDQLAALRELLETAQHYWEIDTRLRQTASFLVHEKPGEAVSSQTTIAEFIQLLRQGTITANPYPVSPMGPAANAVTLATIFQYRSSRRSHRWHFWLDAGSPLWAKGGAATLYGAPFFLQGRLGEPWTAEDEKLAEEQRLKRILADLLSRVSEKIYLCHSDLAVNGQEQMGPLLPLVHSCVSIVPELSTL